MDFAFLLALTLIAPVEADPKWRIGEHDPVPCFLCYAYERDPINIEVARAYFHDGGWTFHEWVGSATVVPGRWSAEYGGELQDVWFTQGGLLWGARTPGAVNFVLKGGVFATWIHANGKFDDVMELTSRAEVGVGVAERLEVTIGLGTDGLSAHIGWRF